VTDGSESREATSGRRSLRESLRQELVTRFGDEAQEGSVLTDLQRQRIQDLIRRGGFTASDVLMALRTDGGYEQDV